jgi:hypothetical protein
MNLSIKQILDDLLSTLSGKGADMVAYGTGTVKQALDTINSALPVNNPTTLGNLSSWYEGPTAPTNPSAGMKWKDTSTTPPTLRRFVSGTTWEIEKFETAFTPVGNLQSTTISTAVTELEAEKLPKAFVPAGNIQATDYSNLPSELDARIGIGNIGRNKIINGEMLIDQRNSGASQTFTAGAAIAYCVDRFYASCTGANVTGQQITGAGNYLKSYQFTGLAGNTGTLFGQRIESYNCRDLTNKVVTVQVELSSSSLTTVTWSSFYATSPDTFSSKTQIATGSLTITPTPTVYTFSFGAGANARNGIALEFTTGALLASQTITYSGIQLEIGRVATCF